MRGSRHLLPIAFLLCACPAPDEPGDVTLPGDDDSAGDDDGGDDDGGDDDVVATERSGVLWLVDRGDVATAGQVDERIFVAASFAEQAPQAMPDVAVYLGLPLPGLLLHPDLDPGFEEGEGCQPIESSDSWAALPDSVDVGTSIRLEPGSGVPLQADLGGGAYALETLGPLPQGPWSLEIPGSAHWPGSETDDVLDFPPALEDVVPTPGTLGSLAMVHVGWIPGGEPAVEVILLRYDSPADTEHWTGLRCLAEDDGTFTINGTALAASGTGDLRFVVARARWTAVPAEPAEGRPALHAGAIRAVTWLMSAGR